VHVINVTPVLHNISIPGEGINIDIPSNGAADIVVTFPARGPTVYYCRFHADEGQAGELFTVAG